MIPPSDRRDSEFSMRTDLEPIPTVGKYLRISGLIPGDIILSFGGGKQSVWIASSTKGPFSHAAIVRNYMQRVEALDDGVGLEAVSEP